MDDVLKVFGKYLASNYANFPEAAKPFAFNLMQQIRNYLKFGDAQREALKPFMRRQYAAFKCAVAQ